MQLITHTPEQTQTLAAALSRGLRKRECIALRGDLGAGKTCFAKGLIAAYAGLNEAQVQSPTFTIVQEYQAREVGGAKLYHFDLYRLEDESELQEIGIDDALEQGISLIEWPDIADKWLGEQTLHIHIEAADGDNAADARCITFDGGAYWSERLAFLKEVELC